MSVESLARAAAKLSDEDLFTLHQRVTSLASKARMRDPVFRARQRERFDRQRYVMVDNVRKRLRCCIPDCTRFAHKATLCRKHWADVPYEDSKRVWFVATMTTMAATEKEYRRIAREAKARAKAAA